MRSRNFNELPKQQVLNKKQDQSCQAQVDIVPKAISKEIQRGSGGWALHQIKIIGISQWIDEKTDQDGICEQQGVDRKD